MTDNPPTLYECLQVARDEGVVGEDDTVLSLTLGMVRGGLIILAGPSRSGKTQLVEGAQRVRGAGEVYEWEADMSPTAAYYSAPHANQSNVHLYPDIATLPDHLERVLKAHGEGRDADRVFTDISAAEGDEATQQSLYAPHSVIGALATDNENFSLNDFPELRNRALILSPDATQEQTKKIHKQQARERAGKVERLINEDRTKEIREYISAIPVSKWEQGGNIIINPMAEEIEEQEPIPSLFLQSRTDLDRMYDFMESVTLFHYTDRMEVTEGGHDRLLVAPADVWLGMQVFGNRMVLSALNLQDTDLAILRKIRGIGYKPSKSELQQELRGSGYNVNDRDVRRSLKSMREMGYIREIDQQGANTYEASEFAAVADHDAGLDYGKIVEAAKTEAHETLAGPIAEQYVSRFCKGDGLIVTHPTTGKQVNITEEDDLESQLRDGDEQMEQILNDKPMADETDTTTDDEGQTDDGQTSLGGGTL